MWSDITWHFSELFQHWKFCCDWAKLKLKLLHTHTHTPFTFPDNQKPKQKKKNNQTNHEIFQKVPRQNINNQHRRGSGRETNMQCLTSVFNFTQMCSQMFTRLKRKQNENKHFTIPWCSIVGVSPIKSTKHRPTGWSGQGVNNVSYLICSSFGRHFDPFLPPSEYITDRKPVMAGKLPPVSCVLPSSPQLRANSSLFLCPFTLPWTC